MRTLFTLLASVAFAQVGHKMETHLLLPASSLQVYRAFTVDWQLDQWLEAREVTMIPEPGGIWRIVDKDANLQEGFCIETIPGEKFSYTIIDEDTQTVDIVITPIESGGSNLQITHRTPDEAMKAERLQSYWLARLNDLRRYLSGLPAGYEAIPQGEEPHPAVLVLHDKFGVNRTIRALCDSLSDAGYYAVACDMFKGEIVTSIEQADRFAAIADPHESVNSAELSLKYLRENVRVQKNRIAILGIGYGGSIAYDLATQDAKLRGVVTWYAGTLPAIEKRESLTGPIFAIFGESDVNHPRPEIEAFDQSLVQAGIRAETVIVSGGSTFSEPQYGEGYNAAATQEAWRRTLNFLDRRLKL